ncbi:MAG TPA: hypothetical protein VEZ70_14420 [Allosphingosinicella sp.]|nr:hypothetical protein [Allosphingosinicella sp.]
MSAGRTAFVALAGIAALAAAKGLRHADQARLAIGPASRLAVHEIEDGHAADAWTAAEVWAEQKEKRRQH